jgi:hypothetical protein
LYMRFKTACSFVARSIGRNDFETYTSKMLVVL